jgi:alpha-beta hydrolase superfamily lysophospholipase
MSSTDRIRRIGPPGYPARQEGRRLVAEPITPDDAGAEEPVQIRHSLATARMADGTNLRTLRWEPDGDPWAVAEIVHGLGEHGGRYDTVAAALAGAGIDPWAYDHRGNGGSGGPRFYVERFSQLHDDLGERLAALRALHPGKPLVMYGHSLGGLISLGYVFSDPPRPLPDLLVLSAPALADNQPGWKRPLARAFTHIVPRLKISNGIPAGGLSRDPAVDAKVAADPMSSSRSTVKLGAEAFKEQDRVRAQLPDLAALPIPTYVLHGSADVVVPPRASELLVGKGNLTRRVHPDLRHECHHEPEHEQVLAEVVDWIRATAPAPPRV